ncbi:PREDICTED: nuclear cap-binding protein subunit 3-like [Branchiostoma belcheri]|uniref:Nuclear cap-binding protein subunit 3 n=1 Tax=Branchiostoma belcheri TaxID=7741 RepID=A0A6P4XXC0_BRABE|nr:PREDICTED: nuclear cap-binding protein subunit 3-like [Branchiostoma belcheri]
MASTGDSDLLNLKISIDADELSDMEEDVPVEEDTEKPEGSSGDGPEAPHVEIKRSLEGRVLPNLGERKYENKAGDFITGIDITDPEFLEKRQQRAKRFGVTPPAEEEAFAKRLELLREELKEASEAEWGIRPEALHVEGVDDLNTQQVFDYFKQFAPGSIEWINDTSCNVVWLDPNTAARAILYYTDSSKIEDSTSKDSSTEETKKEEEVPKTEEKMEESSVVTEEEDDDELNLMSDDELEERETRGKETQTKSTEEDKTEGVKVKTEDEPMEEQTTGSPKGSEVDIPSKFNLREAKPAIPCERARRLFIRYATNDDKKARGAQRKSKFYMKYGNPNFGGMKGIISESWRRRYKEKKRKAIISQYRKQRSGGKYNDPDGGDGGEEEEEVEEPENDWETELELYRQEQERRLLKEALQTQEKQRPSRPPQKKQKVSNVQAYPGSESEPGSESGSDSDGIDLEYELQQLTKQESKRPARTMYADEVEQRIKQLRHSVKGGSQLAVRVPSSGGVKSRLGIKPDGENKPRLTYTISNVRDRLGGKQQQQPSQGGASVLQRLGKAASRGESILHRLGQKRPASDSESEEEEEDDDDDEEEDEYDRDEGRDSPELARDLRKRLGGKRTGGKFDFKNLPSLSIEVTRDDSD